jgi:hypothetical protein
MEGDKVAPLCFVCGKDLPLSSGRRTLHPPISPNEDVRTFFLNVIVGSRAPYVFTTNGPKYACKPCYAKLEKGSKQYKAVLSLIGELRKVVKINGKIAIGNDDNAGIVCLSCSASVSDSQSTRKRSQVSENAIVSTPKRPNVVFIPEEQHQESNVHGDRTPKTNQQNPTAALVDIGLCEATPTGIVTSRVSSTPGSQLKVSHIRNGKTIKSYNVKFSPFKRIGKTLRYKKVSYTARACLSLPAGKSEALRQIVTAVKMECRRLCQLKPRPSVLRVKSVDELKSFSWRQVILELRLKAPTFLTILQAVGECHQPRRKRRQKARNSVVGMAAAILLKERNQHMCKPQTVLSTVLYAGRASKKVH